MSISTTHLVINSKNRTSDSKSSTNFTYYIGQPIIVSNIVLKSISIPNTCYNITSKNNTLVVNINGSIQTIVITEGQYTLLQLINFLEAKFLLYGSILNITQNPNTDRLTFTSNVLFEIVLSAFNTLNIVLGFLNILDSPSLVKTTINQPKLQGPLNFYIISKVLGIGSNGRFSRGVQDAYLMSIPNKSEYGFVNFYEPPILDTAIQSYTTGINAQFIDIQITDSDLVELDLNGADIEIVYKLYIKPDTIN